MKLRHDLAALLPRMSDAQLLAFSHFHERYAADLPAIASGLYDRLSPADQQRFLQWWLKRWGGIDLVNAVERSLYDTQVDLARREERPAVMLDGKSYRLRDFRSQGFDFQLLGYDWFLGIHDVLYNQYEHADIGLRADDVIIDAGAFIGDTAVLFHHKLGGRCQLHSFELLDENLALLLHNLQRNGVPDEAIVINKLALSDRTGDEITVSQPGLQGATSIFGRAGQGERVQTITLDDYVMRLNLPRVDFIKMDIEGAEVPALRGARQTIQHFRPRLAICLYHRWDDALRIPQVIHEMGVGYRFAFKWVQLRDGWEAVLMATPSDASATVAAGPAAATHDALDAAVRSLSGALARSQAELQSLRRARAARVAAVPAEA